MCGIEMSPSYLEGQGDEHRRRGADADPDVPHLCDELLGIGIASAPDEGADGIGGGAGRH